MTSRSARAFSVVEFKLNKTANEHIVAGTFIGNTCLQLMQSNFLAVPWAGNPGKSRGAEAQHCYGIVAGGQLAPATGAGLKAHDSARLVHRLSGTLSAVSMSCRSFSEIFGAAFFII